MTHLVQLFNALASRGPAAPPDAGPSHFRAEPVLADAGFSVETIPAFPWPWNPAARMHNAYLGVDPLRALRVLLTRRKAAVICAHMESAVLILLLRRLFGFRPPVVIWEVPWSPGWRFREKVTRLAIPRADRCVVFGTNQVRLVQERFGAGTPVSVIPFCIDTAFYRPLPPPAGVAPYVLSCGLDAGRDFDILLAVADGLPVGITMKVGRGVVPGPARPGVTVITEHLSYPRYRDLYAGAAVVVVATRTTTNASGVTSLMEAMAMGRPVIVSDNPALGDYLPPPDAGIVIPVGDAAALRSAITALLADPAKAEAMGRRAREFALARFDPRRHFQAMAALLSEVAGRSVGQDLR